MLKNVLKDVHGMDEKANLIGVEMDRQINQLDKVYNDLNDT